MLTLSRSDVILSFFALATVSPFAAASLVGSVDAAGGLLLQPRPLHDACSRPLPLLGPSLLLCFSHTSG